MHQSNEAHLEDSQANQENCLEAFSCNFWTAYIVGVCERIDFDVAAAETVCKYMQFPTGRSILITPPEDGKVIYIHAT